MKNKKKNPLQTAWNILSIFATVVSLSSLADSLVQWGEFISILVESYKSLVYPIWEFLLGWLPFSIPELVKDYLTLGVITTLSFYHGHFISEGESEDFVLNTFIKLFLAPIFAPIWPLLMLGMFDAKTEKEIVLRNSALQWLGASLIVFVLLLILNSTLLT